MIGGCCGGGGIFGIWEEVQREKVLLVSFNNGSVR
jgi:hypothetical protein